MSNRGEQSTPCGGGAGGWVRDREEYGAGEIEKLTAVWKSSHEILLRKCMHWTRGNARDAEDLLGEACLRVLESARRSEIPVAAPLHWWTIVIGNLGRDRRRRARLRLVVRDPQIRVGEIPDGAASLDQIVSAREKLEQARLAFRRLPGSRGTALVFRCDGEPYEEIARRLQITTTNARKQVQLARTALRQSSGPAYGRRALAPWDA